MCLMWRGLCRVTNCCFMLFKEGMMCLREKPPLQLPADRLLVKTSSFLQDHDNHLH